MLPGWIRRPFDRAMLRDPAYRFLFEPGPADEVVSIDCETTGLNPRKDDIVTVAAIRIRGARILSSERFEATVRPMVKMNPEAIKVHRLRERDVATGRAMADILPALLRFLGGRPLVGYYLEFDVAMLNRYIRRWLRIELPSPTIEVSKLYYERKYADAPPGSHVDLSFAAILSDLNLPMLDQHDAYADALMTAMIYLTLRDLKARGVKIPRQPHKGFGHFGVGCGT
jgi:DNA polymerase III subunit epsilon